MINVCHQGCAVAKSLGPSSRVFDSYIEVLGRKEKLLGRLVSIGEGGVRKEKQ